MDLALFTPGAYIWPVYRNFEAFIASLGAPADAADSIADSNAYPARHYTESGLADMPERVSQRLTSLHRELYRALLRPSELFDGEERSLPELFWSDLADTPAGGLLNAFYFYFIGRPATALPVTDGLAVLRAAFFNHEAALPELWLSSALERLKHLRASREVVTEHFNAPPSARSRDLAFALVSESGRSHLGAAWTTGRIRRTTTGLLAVDVEIGVEPALAADAGQLERVRPQLAADVRANLERIFAWPRETEAA
jgi:hypothetical protein